MIGGFRHAAASAITTGADGVEIHAVNGICCTRSSHPNANHRTDEYGGSVENRARFVIEVAQAAAEAIGGTGIRISQPSPSAVSTRATAEAVRAQYRHLVGGLAPLNLAYLNVHQETTNFCAPSVTRGPPRCSSSASGANATASPRTSTRSSPTSHRSAGSRSPPNARV